MLRKVIVPIGLPAVLAAGVAWLALAATRTAAELPSPMPETKGWIGLAAYLLLAALLTDRCIENGMFCRSDEPGTWWPAAALWNVAALWAYVLLA